LLADRFQLVIRQDKRDGPAYALVVDKNGTKLKPSASGEEDGSSRGGDGGMTGKNVSMESLALDLMGLLGRPVVDRTGLKGKYDFKLQFSPRAAPEAAPDPSRPSIFTALREQLGLRLEPIKAPVDSIAIVHVEKPSEN
jgi:uncharacterized protein (TIGR03435 family)